MNLNSWESVSILIIVFCYSGLGFDVTIMARSILLRGFDQEMAGKIGAHLQSMGVRLIFEMEPSLIKKIEDGNPPRIQVVAGKGKETKHDEIYNTVILAIGRDPSTGALRLAKKANVKLSNAGKVIVDKYDRTNVSHIYSVGDCAEGRMELATVAIHAGRRLAKRLFSNYTELTDYQNVPTTVFTPLEYGCIGLSEEDATAKYGAGKIETYFSSFQPLEYVIPNKLPESCFVKLVCLKTAKNLVLGLHYFGPDAGEVWQGFALGFKLKATKADYDGN